jgi:uncharacterized protein (DUF2267 family)
MQPREDHGGPDVERRSRFAEIVETEALLPAHVTVQRAVEAVLGTLVERLTAGAAHELLEGLPSVIRPFVAPSVHQRDGRPIVRLDRAELIARVAGELQVTPVHAEQLCAAVFSAARAELPPDIVAGVVNQLPRDIEELWRTPPSSIPVSSSSTKIGLAARHDLEIEIRNNASLPPGVSAAAAFSAVMCAVSDRLSGGEVRDVALSLPSGIRELVERCTLHRGEPGIVFGREGLVDRVAEHLAIEDEDAPPIIGAVFRAVKRVLPWKEVAAVASQLPSDLRELWERS